MKLDPISLRLFVAVMEESTIAAAAAREHLAASAVSRRIEAGADLRTATAAQVMHPSPRRIAPDALAVDAAEMMEAHAITSVLVVDAAGALAGVVHIGDLMRAKVI